MKLTSHTTADKSCFNISDKLLPGLRKTKQSEDGFVLVLAMMIMVVVTLIGLAATTTTMFEIQIAGNEKWAQKQFFRADSALNQDLAARPMGGSHSAPSVLSTVGVKTCSQYITDGDSPIASYDPDSYGKNVDVFFAQRGLAGPPYTYEYKICASDVNNTTMASLTAGIVHGQPPAGFFGSGGLEY